MPQLNLKDRTIEAKLVYFGAPSSGRKTNLTHLQGAFPDGRGGDLVTREVGPDRLLSVKWMPAHLEPLNGCEVAVNVFALQGEAPTADACRSLFEGADGIVVVLDGEEGSHDRNRRSLDDMRRACADAGLQERVPVVLQLNKRDLPNAMPIDDLLREVGSPSWPHIEASASNGAGVVETVSAATQLIVRSIRQPTPEPRAPAVPARARLDAVDREVTAMRATHDALAARQAELELTLAALAPRLEAALAASVARLTDALTARIGEALTTRSAEGAAQATKLEAAIAAKVEGAVSSAATRLGEALTARVTEGVTQTARLEAGFTSAVARMDDALSTRLGEAATRTAKEEATATRAHTTATGEVTRKAIEDHAKAMDAALRGLGERGDALVTRLEPLEPRLDALTRTLTTTITTLFCEQLRGFDARFSELVDEVLSLGQALKASGRKSWWR